MNDNFETPKNDKISAFGQAVNKVMDEAKYAFKTMSKLTVFIVCILVAMLISVLPLAMFLFAVYFAFKVISGFGRKTNPSEAVPMISKER